ncbi:MAG: hypothetical protein HY033_05320 [Ignavibacteriae bacterium]|nr:hypothetical protein [Ignavibacteria bacterium]MBI3364309.1 hypothetical protein [Ignavibacteriota bacterium]
MKKLAVVGLILMLAFGTTHAQLKSQDERVSAAESLIRPAQSINSFLGFLNSDNFMMRHNISFSYLSAGGQGLSLASYTNSMFYRIADPLNLHVDLTLQGSPFGQYGSSGQNDFNKLFISRAELNYHPADNMFITLQFSQRPFGRYSNYSNGFYDELFPYSTTIPSGDH